jgi:hypothetical protein
MADGDDTRKMQISQAHPATRWPLCQESWGQGEPVGDGGLVAVDAAGEGAQVRTGVSIVVLSSRAIALTVERCLPASVFSSEVSMTQQRRPSRNMSWARR